MQQDYLCHPCCFKSTPTFAGKGQRDPYYLVTSGVTLVLYGTKLITTNGMAELISTVSIKYQVEMMKI